jgi:hypothetical protein
MNVYVKELVNGWRDWRINDWIHGFIVRGKKWNLISWKDG